MATATSSRQYSKPKKNDLKNYSPYLSKYGQTVEELTSIIFRKIQVFTTLSILCKVWTIYFAPLTISRPYQNPYFFDESRFLNNCPYLQSLDNILRTLCYFASIPKNRLKNIFSILFQKIQVFTTLSILCKVWTIYFAPLTISRPYQNPYFFDESRFLNNCPYLQSLDNILRTLCYFASIPKRPIERHIFHPFSKNQGFYNVVHTLQSLDNIFRTIDYFTSIQETILFRRIQVFY